MVFNVYSSYYRSQQSLAVSYQWCLTGFCRGVSLVPGGTTSKPLPCRKDTKPVSICLTFRNSIQAIRHCSFPYTSLGRSTRQSIRLKLLARCIRNFCLRGLVCLTKVVSMSVGATICWGNTVQVQTFIRQKNQQWSMRLRNCARLMQACTSTYLFTFNLWVYFIE